MAIPRMKQVLQNHMDTSFKLLEQYSWLLDSYLLDFFTENHMNKLPKSWRKFIHFISLEEFNRVLSYTESTGNNVFPLSLICIRILIKYLSLSREMTNKNKVFIAQHIDNNKIDITRMSKWNGDEESFILFTHPKLWNLFLKHVKPKKRYEILKIAEITAYIAKRLNVQFLVDVGSGLGHLSRVLAFGFNLSVCSIETQTPLTEQAKKLDAEFVTTASKYLSNVENEKLKNRSPVHMNKTITSDFDQNQFVEELKKAFSVTKRDFRFGIIGLHPCGDLAAVLLRTYINCPQALFINLVGCCYHKLTTTCDGKENYGFPLSQFSREKYFEVSYEARALACHAIETYCQRIQEKNWNHLKVHCYRAALEKIIHRNWPHLKKQALSNVKAGPDIDFIAYCNSALKKLGVFVPAEEFHSKETLNNLLQWENVVKFYSLRLMFAPLIETVILIDRLVYLLEEGASCRIKAVFDPILSPRNQLLLSEKKPT